MVAGFRFTLKDGHGRLISELIKIKSQGELVVHTACFVLGDYADRNIKCAKVAQEGFGNGKDDLAFCQPQRNTVESRLHEELRFYWERHYGSVRAAVNH